MSTYIVTDAWTLGDVSGVITDITGRQRAVYRDSIGNFQTCVLGEPLLECCDEPADLCRCGNQIEEAA